MANNIAQLKTDIRTAFTNNLDAATRTKLANRFVSAYPNHWAKYLADGGTDTPANRGTFAIEMIFRDMRNVFRAGSVIEGQATLPPAETIE